MKSGRDESKQEADQDLLLTQAVNCHLSIVIAVLFFPLLSAHPSRLEVLARFSTVLHGHQVSSTAGVKG